jgi:hypothetical protein
MISEFFNGCSGTFPTINDDDNIATMMADVRCCVEEGGEISLSKGGASAAFPRKATIPLLLMHSRHHSGTVLYSRGERLSEGKAFENFEREPFSLPCAMASVRESPERVIACIRTFFREGTRRNPGCESLRKKYYFAISSGFLVAKRLTYSC